MLKYLYGGRLKTTASSILLEVKLLADRLARDRNSKNNLLLQKGSAEVR